ncbi:MAG: zinc-ribbon domain-containing protein [Candidatus Hermodarchaeota archaeon]
MSKFCPYCGNPVKESDKFCIICGKPLLTDIPKREKKSKVQEPKREETIKPVERKLETIKHVEAEDVIDEESKPIKTSIFKKARETGEVKPLPEEVKEQMVYYIEYNDIQLNKKVLVEKLTELSKSTKDPKYEYDHNFKKEITVKLEALKTLIDELKQKESVIKQNLEEPFIVQKITGDIDTKIFQLENLSKEHKLHKIDDETFEKLKEKYKQEKADLEKQKEELIAGMKLWIKDLKLEKAELNSERKLNKGRFHAKEIAEDDFKNKDKDFDLKIKKTETKIKTLEDLTK